MLIITVVSASLQLAYHRLPTRRIAAVPDRAKITQEREETSRSARIKHAVSRDIVLSS